MASRTRICPLSRSVASGTTLNGFKRTNEYQALLTELIVSSYLQETLRDYFLENGTTQAVDAIDVRARVSEVSEKAEFVRGQWIPGADDDPEKFPRVY